MDPRLTFELDAPKQQAKLAVLERCREGSLKLMLHLFCRCAIRQRLAAYPVALAAASSPASYSNSNVCKCIQ